MGSSGGRHQIRLPITFAHDITISLSSSNDKGLAGIIG